MFDRDFHEKVTSKNTSCRVSPRGFAWCGDDSVVLYWRTLGLLLVNPFADWLKYTYDKQDTLVLVTETDGLRVFSSLKQELIRVVGIWREFHPGTGNDCGSVLGLGGKLWRAATTYL